ncbi:MAG: very short patch repair endonuclease [Bacteroidetes bacterium]|nr:very short patch repair endonuclease [Bacteroidota bacterium]
MDNLTPEQRRKNMQGIRSTNTIPEKIIAKELKKRKIYFSQYSKKLPGKPDFIFRRKKVVVFVDSDFWHGHPRRFVMPKSNVDYWENKIRSNRERDTKNNRDLKKKGWTVLRLWEHDVKKNTEKSLEKILIALKKNTKDPKL